MYSNSLKPEEPIEIEQKETSFFQIDLLKAVMIAFVILDHSMGYTNYRGMGFELWERMSIPMFLIILGFNMGKSFAREGEKSLKELYSFAYFKKKFWRFIFPYLIFYLVSTFIGFLLYGINFPETFEKNWILEYIVFQKALLQGPGNWFIPVLFQSIILMPLLYKFFSKKPILSLIICFIIEVCMHLFLFFYIGEITSVDDFIRRELSFRYIVFLYLSALGMGIWFSQNYNLLSKRNLFVWILFPISLIYMTAWDFFAFRLEIDGSGIVRGDYNYFTFIYSALIFLIIMRLVPDYPKNIITKVISPIGKATFHIYLIQDLYFAILYNIGIDVWTSPTFVGLVNPLNISSFDFLVNIGLLVINWTICISFGTIWWYVEKKGLTLLLKT